MTKISVEITVENRTRYVREIATVLIEVRRWTAHPFI